MRIIRISFQKFESWMEKHRDALHSIRVIATEVLEAILVPVLSKT